MGGRGGTIGEPFLLAGPFPGALPPLTLNVTGGRQPQLRRQWRAGAFPRFGDTLSSCGPVYCQRGFTKVSVGAGQAVVGAVATAEAAVGATIHAQHLQANQAALAFLALAARIAQCRVGRHAYADGIGRILHQCADPTFGALFDASHGAKESARCLDAPAAVAVVVGGTFTAETAGSRTPARRQVLGDVGAFLVRQVRPGDVQVKVQSIVGFKVVWELRVVRAPVAAAVHGDLCVVARVKTDDVGRQFPTPGIHQQRRIPGTCTPRRRHARHKQQDYSCTSTRCHVSLQLGPFAENIVFQ